MNLYDLETTRQNPYSKIINFKGVLFKYIEKYNENHGDIINKELLNLKFNNYFNNTINNLPNGIICIILGDYFNENVDLLPETIKYLQLGHYFNKSLNDLPSSLKILEFNIKSDKIITNYSKFDYNYLLNDDYDNEYNMKMIVKPEINTKLKEFYIKIKKENDFYRYKPYQMVNQYNNYNQKSELLPGKLKYIITSNKYNFDKRYHKLILEYTSYTKIYNSTDHYNMSRIYNIMRNYGGMAYTG